MGKLTQQDVLDWALAHGFSRCDNGALLTSFKGGQVVIEPLGRNVRISCISGGYSRPLTVHPSRLHIDEWGMLAGAGLSTSFAQRVKSEDDFPPWFTEEYKAAVRPIFSENRPASV